MTGYSTFGKLRFSSPLQPTRGAQCADRYTRTPARARARLLFVAPLQDHGKGSASGLGAFSIVVVLLYVCFFEIGLGPIPWLLGGEMLPESPRAAVMSTLRPIACPVRCLHA